MRFAVPSFVVEASLAVAEAAENLEQRLRQGLPVTAEVAALQQAVGVALAAVAERLAL